MQFAQLHFSLLLHCLTGGNTVGDCSNSSLLCMSTTVLFDMSFSPLHIYSDHYISTEVHIHSFLPVMTPAI